MTARLGDPPLDDRLPGAASAVFQIFPGAIYAKVPLGIAAFLLG